MTARRASFADVLRELIADAASLPGAELGPYLLLCSHQATTRQPLPDDAGELARLARCTLTEWTACARRILARFRQVKDGWLHLRLATEIDHGARVATSRSAAARRAACIRHHPHLMADCTQSHTGEPEASSDYLPGFEPEPGSVTHARAPAAHPSGFPELSVTDPSRTNTHAHPRGGPVSNGIEHTHTNSRARARACVGARVREAPAAPPPELVAEAERALTAAGVRPHRGDPRVVALVAAGVAPAYFGEVALEALTRGGVGDAYAWAIAKVAATLRTAETIHGTPVRAAPSAAPSGDTDKPAEHEHLGRPSREALEALQARRHAAAAGSAAPSTRALDAWLALRERERADERLTPYQAAAWRAGLRLPEDADAWAPAGFEREKEQQP